MKSNYRRIGDYIKPVSNRNVNDLPLPLKGINIDKFFMPSVANVVGTDLSKYKIVKPGQFACNRMHVGRDQRLPVALLEGTEEIIVSPAYDVFEIINEKELLPEYLMMRFSRKEFDRRAWFHTDGDVRGGLPWESFKSIDIPVPSIEKQREIVKEYEAIVNRIKLNEEINKKLEETAQAIYKQWFVEFGEKELKVKTLGELCSLITDGKHGDCVDEINSGYYFVSVKDIINGEIIYQNARQITKDDFEETHRRTDLKAGDILITNAGTIGRMAIVRDLPETNKTTFQKSVAILKPKSEVVKTHYLYLLLKSHLKEITDLAGGSTQSNLLLSDLRSFEIKYLGLDFVAEIENKTKPIFKLIELKGIDNQKLTELKNLLLSKLAKVRV